MTPEELARAQEFVAGLRWQFASSLPEHPHEYSVKAWLDAEGQQTFSWLADLIDRTGYPGEFWGARWTYLDLPDAQAYWVSRSVYPPIDPRGMLNRRKLDGPGQMRLEVES